MAARKSSSEMRLVFSRMVIQAGSIWKLRLFTHCRQVPLFAGTLPLPNTVYFVLSTHQCPRQLPHYLKPPLQNRLVWLDAVRNYVLTLIGKGHELLLTWQNVIYLKQNRIALRLGRSYWAHPMRAIHKMAGQSWKKTRLRQDWPLPETNWGKLAITRKALKFACLTVGQSAQVSVVAFPAGRWLEVDHRLTFWSTAVSRTTLCDFYAWVHYAIDVGETLYGPTTRTAGHGHQCRGGCSIYVYATSTLNVKNFGWSSLLISRHRELAYYSLQMPCHPNADIQPVGVSPLHLADLKVIKEWQGPGLHVAWMLLCETEGLDAERADIRAPTTWKLGAGVAVFKLVVFRQSSVSTLI